MNRRAAFRIATDENGEDPAKTRTILRTWAMPRMARGAAPVVASKQTEPAPHRSHRPESTPPIPLSGSRNVVGVPLARCGSVARRRRSLRRATCPQLRRGTPPATNPKAMGLLRSPADFSK